MNFLGELLKRKQEQAQTERAKEAMENEGGGQVQGGVALSKSLRDAGFKDEIPLKLPREYAGEGRRKMPSQVGGDGKLRMAGTGWTFKGRTVDFVLTKDGRLVLGAGHSILSDGKGVAFGGQLKFNSTGELVRITNTTGHYRTPSGIGLTDAAKRYLQGLGIDVSKAKVEEFKQ